MKNKEIKIDIFDLFNNDNDVKVGDIFKNCEDNKLYLVIETNFCEDIYYSSMELYPLPYKELPSPKILIQGILNNKCMKNIRSFYKDSISILYSECNDADYENHYEYISHINLKLETYLTIDEAE